MKKKFSDGHLLGSTPDKDFFFFTKRKMVSIQIHTSYIYIYVGQSRVCPRPPPPYQFMHTLHVESPPPSNGIEWGGDGEAAKKVIFLRVEPLIPSP